MSLASAWERPYTFELETQRSRVTTTTRQRLADFGAKRKEPTLWDS
ncbi:hypothetical protein [Haloterrigena sp. H1]|nr:hypothetical protein [Haloterrigena sp. H1]